MLGYSYMQINKTADAIDAFLQAKTLDPEKPQTLFFLGIAYAIQEKFDDAIFYLEKSFKAGFEPKSIINQKLADIYLLKGNFEKALKSYTDIIDLGIADLSIYTKAVWVCIEKIDKPQRALGIADKAIAANPDAAMGYNLRGWAYVAYGDYIKAEADLLKAISIDPKLDSAYLNLGQMYEKQGMNERAVEYYKKAYELGNGDSISSLAAVKFNKLITSPSWNSSQQ
jgi:superkiller protein 3